MVSYQEETQKRKVKEAIKIVLRQVQPGSYGVVGSRLITITNAFYIGIFEVTQKQYELVMGEGKSNFMYKGDMRPVDCFSMADIRGAYSKYDCTKTSMVAPDSFVGLLRMKTGFNGVDLPTSWQWDCAHWAETDGTVPDMSKDGRHGRNCNDGKGGLNGQHTIVGSYQPNRWGIYDMHGNVWERCINRATDSGVGIDRRGPANIAKRGGSWHNSDKYIYSCYDPELVNDQDGISGFRLVVNMPSASKKALLGSSKSSNSGTGYIPGLVQGIFYD